MDFLEKIAEEKILEAMRNGEFDHLSCKGKPLELEDMSGVPEDLRMGYKILKNAGMLPEELELKKEIVSLQRLIECCYTEEERKEARKRLNEKMLRFNLMLEQRGSNPALKGYYSKIYEKFINK